jgi:hypothetical protein
MSDDQYDLLSPGTDQIHNEWMLLNAIRESFSIARTSQVTYSDAAVRARELAPRLISENSPIIRALEAQDVLYYRERAEALSKPRKQRVSALTLIDRDITQLKQEMEGAPPGALPAMESRLKRLGLVRETLDETKWTETALIHRDADVAGSRRGVALPRSGEGQGYREYNVGNDRRLRVKVLHPDPDEWKSGVDLIYEHYWKPLGAGDDEVLVHVAALQYKRWDGRAIYTSDDPRLESQLEAATAVFCGNGLCNSPSSRDHDWYRLPHCAAFLRPTDLVQNRRFWNVTRAWHVPVCLARAALKDTGRGGKKLTSSAMQGICVNSETFRTMYNRAMIGSRWVRTSELDEVYARSKLFDPQDRAVMHAQVYRSN